MQAKCFVLLNEAENKHWKKESLQYTHKKNVEYWLVCMVQRTYAFTSTPVFRTHYYHLKPKTFFITNLQEAPRK